jgi:ATP-dependent protease HslVU (ClpYQ) peptidase subunit
MTVIAVYLTDDMIVLGADTQVTYGDNKILESYYGKLYKINNLYLGCSGSCLEAQFFRRFLETKRLRSNFTESDFSDLILEFYDEYKARTKGEAGSLYNQYLLVHDGKAFIFSNWLIKEVEEFEAIGSGRETARTAFEVYRQLGEPPDIATILKVTCKIDLYCHEPITLYSIPRSAPSDPEPVEDSTLESADSVSTTTPKARSRSSRTPKA